MSDAAFTGQGNQIHLFRLWDSVFAVNSRLANTVTAARDGWPPAVKAHSPSGDLPLPGEDCPFPRWGCPSPIWEGKIPSGGRAALKRECRFPTRGLPVPHEQPDVPPAQAAAPPRRGMPDAGRKVEGPNGWWQAAFADHERVSGQWKIPCLSGG